MTGAAATTTALVAIGPAGMIGGLITLGIIGIIANTVSKYGLKKVVAAVVRELYKKRETRQSILTKIENYPITNTLRLKLVPSAHGIRFEAVTFGYEGASPVLRGVDLECPAGSVTAVVGPSGSGKTTLSLLVLRFFDVDAGAIRSRSEERRVGKECRSRWSPYH